MTTTGREHSILPARNLLSPGFFWAILRLPEMFAASLAATAVALTLARAIPQQPAEFSTPGEFVIWVSNLPPFFQQTFQPLNGLGLFKIYHTPWFWFPVAWLTLTGLISLADQLPAAWQRLRPAAGAVRLPHPWSRSRRQTIRLAAPQHASEGTSVEAPLAALQAKLVANGYRIVPSQPGQTVTAGRRVWRWSGPALQVTGILLVLAGVVVQSLWGRVE
ncbi:MAG: cytochrome c biogenesis protein ResB, partial [Anaerolineae bacterium]